MKHVSNYDSNRKFSNKFAKIAMSALLCFAVIAQPTQSVEAAGAPSVSAVAAVTIDKTTGRVLYQKDAYSRRPMASTTKIMTAIIAIESGKLDAMVTIGANAAGVEGSSMWLKKGEVVKLEDLVYGLMLNSGNDAAVAISEYISGSAGKFAEVMTQKAHEIGAKNTAFKNPNGLDQDGHYTTAYDLALIARYALSNEKFAQIVKTKSVKLPATETSIERYLTNHNKMLSLYGGADGVKTGFTKKSGRTLVSSATRDGWQVITVTLNAPSDWSDHKKMFDFAFDTYKYAKVVDSSSSARVAVVNGVQTSVAVKPERDFGLAITPSEKSDIKVTQTMINELKAPFYKDAKVGVEQVFFKENLVGEVNLLASESVNVIFDPYIKKTYLKSLINVVEYLLTEFKI